MLSRASVALKRAPVGKRYMADAAKPMTRFIQYPFDKTKMAEVREWANTEEFQKVAKKMRSIDGVKEIEFSFCPGQGWLAARYIFNDLEDLKKFGDQPVLA